MIEEEGEELVSVSEISININNYNDIFSSFDPRPYSHKALSDDFLIEIKKASAVKTSNNIEVRFLIPRKNKDQEHEAIIKKRLKEYFKKHHEMTHQKVKKMKNKGIKFVAIGSLLIMITALIKTFIAVKPHSFAYTFLIDLVLVAMEPAGWFTTWSGLDKIILGPESWEEEISFYDKMAKAEFHFVGV